MPIYEYKCGKCGMFEVTQRITEDPLKKCPTCHHKVQKLISNTSFQLKGTGWYVTDYGRGSGSKGEKRDSDGKTNGASKSSESTTKPASTENASSTEKSSGEKSTSSVTSS